VLPLVKVVLAPGVRAVPFAVTDCVPSVLKRIVVSDVAALTFGMLALAARIKSVDVSRIIARTFSFFVFKFF